MIERARRVGKWAPLVSALLLSACGGRIYINSPALQASTAKAASSMPAEADALKPFDDQLANLATFATSEDLAVARYWTGVRDAHFVRLIAMNQARDRTGRLITQVDNRLVELVGNGHAPFMFDPAPLVGSKAAIDSFAASQRRNYLAQPGADAKLDLKCPAAIARFSPAEANRLVAAGNALENRLAQLTLLCQRSADKDTEINSIANVNGEIGEARVAAASADVKLNTSLSDRAQDLERQIDAAETFAKSGSGVASLEKWLTDIKSVLDDAAAGAKFVGWDQAADALDAALKAQVCSSSTVAHTAKTEAKCGDVEPTSTAGRIQATWGLAKALAQVADAGAPQRRSVQWLLAAKAIVAAERADAKLTFDEAQAVALAEHKRMEALQREAAYLQTVKESAVGPRGDCHNGLPGGDVGPNPHCQFAAYVDAWNEGRIPAQILEYRPIQIGRSFAVRRARAVAQKQHVLASAGTMTLRDYGAGGLTAAIIAQALFDAAILGVGIGDL